MNNKYAQDMEAALDRVTAERDAALSSLDSADASAQTLHEVISRLKSERDAAQAELKTQTLRADAATGDANEAERGVANWKRKACESAERETALRKEVHEIKESMAYRGSLLGRVQAERDALQQDLNQRDEQIATLDLQREAHLRNSQVAERRVRVLEGLLAKYYNRSDVCAFMAKDIGAVLKPVEGGGDA